MRRASPAVSKSPWGSQSLDIRNVLKARVSSLTAPTRTAPVGQAAAQWSQERDLSPVTTALPSAMVIVSSGHTSTQRPQPMHFSGSMTVVTFCSILFRLRDFENLVHVEDPFCPARHADGFQAEKRMAVVFHLADDKGFDDPA